MCDFHTGHDGSSGVRKGLKNSEIARKREYGETRCKRRRRKKRHRRILNNGQNTFRSILTEAEKLERASVNERERMVR